MNPRFWRAKPGPLVRRSRLWHAALGSVIPALAHRLGGHEWLAWATCGVLIGSCLWEAATREWIRGWHPYGDVVDLYAFAVPCIAWGAMALAGFNPWPFALGLGLGAAGGHFIQE